MWNLEIFVCLLKIQVNKCTLYHVSYRYCFLLWYEQKFKYLQCILFLLLSPLKKFKMKTFTVHLILTTFSSEKILEWKRLQCILSLLLSSLKNLENENVYSASYPYYFLLWKNFRMKTFTVHLIFYICLLWNSWHLQYIQYILFLLCTCHLI